MKKEKSFLNVEWKEKAKKQLKSLVVPFIILLVIAFGVLVILFTKTKSDEEEVVKINTYDGGTENIVLENDALKLVMESETTQFSLTVKATGEIWYSNPLEVDNDSIALPVEKSRLKSTILLTYSTKNGVDTLFDNYTYSILNKIYSIEASEDSIKVCYSIGDVNAEYVIPTVLSEDRMDAYLTEMDETQRSLIKDYYKKYDINKLGAKDDREGLLALYPMLENEIIYVLRSTTKDNLKSKFQTYFEEIGYTYEEFLEDKENDLSALTSDKPIFNVNVIYKLDGSDLIVDVPMSEIEYKDSSPIINLSVLPYFGAGAADEDGYMFVPEGGGAIIDFNNGKISQSSYFANLYGWDMAQGRTSLVHDTRVMFGVFGIAKNNNSFICILEDGSPYASIQADISGKNNNYNYVNSVYTIDHREQYDVAEKYNGKMFVYEKGTKDEDIIQRFRFVDSGDYVDMSKEYQNYLCDKYSVGFTMNDDTKVPVAIEIVGAVDKIEQVLGIPVSRPLKLTTYKEAEAILKELSKDGMTNLSVKLSGWMNGGINQKVLNKVKPVPSLGSKKDLKKLISYANNNGFTMYLDGITNYSIDSDVFDGFLIYRDTARLVTNEKVVLKEFSTIWYGQDELEDSYYLLKPSLVLTMMQNLTNAAVTFDSKAVSFKDIGYELSADYSKKKFVSRQKVLNQQTEKLSEIKKSGNSVMINGGNDYAIAYSDFITNMDLGGSKYAIIDHIIPFYQIALHGYINYTGEALNITKNYKEELLLSAEYGAGLYFNFMQSESTVLQKTMYTEYYGSTFSDWHDKMLEIYNRYEKELGHIFNQKITSNKEIAKNVKLTTYEDGTKIYVNYRYSDCVEDGITIPARDYVVIK